MFKKNLFILLSLSLLLSQTAFAGFDDFLTDVINQTANQAIGVQTNEYSFAPGDVVVQKDNYLVYYSGIEQVGEVRTLLLTMQTAQGNVVLKYPSPSVIRLKEYQFQILEFSNLKLKLKIIHSQSQS